jgi:hypothetical protein
VAPPFNLRFLAMKKFPRDRKCWRSMRTLYASFASISCDSPISVRVESRMGAVAWGLWPTPRFPSPLIKPGVPISGTRPSDWLHRKAHGDKLTARGFGTVSNSPSPLDTAISGGACHCWCLQAHRQSPRPRHLRKRTRSRGPFLHRHYPASTVIRPRPTPAMAAALRDVEAATLTLDGSPPVTTNHPSDVPCQRSAFSPG